MAGTKRRRGGSKKAAVHKVSSVSPVNRLIARLLQWQKESPTAVERLWNDESPVQFLSEDFRATSEPNKDAVDAEDTLGYVLLLAAQTLERLTSRENSAVNMAWLAFAVAPLACPPSDSWSTKTARHVAGRAFLASVGGAHQALAQMVAHPSSDERTAMAMLAAILTLDTAFSSAGIKDSTNSSRQARQVWERSRAALRLHAEKYWLEKEQSEMDDSTVWDAKMEACWSCIHEEMVAVQSLHDSFAQAIDIFYLITDHSTVSSRWVAMALTIRGEPHWLETSIVLLEGPWMEYWSCPVISDVIAQQEASSTSIRKRGTNDPVENGTLYELFGPAVAVMLVSKMVQFFRTINKSIERKFKGNLYVYMNACWSQRIDNKQDPRDTGAMLLYRLLDVHRRCLDEMQIPVVNDDDAIESTEAPGSYYPFISDVLEQLSTAISSSPSLSHEAQVQVRSALDGLAVAFIFRHQQNAKVIDARLLQFAMLQVVRALNISRGSNESASSLSKKSSMLPLPVPAFSKTKSQKKKHSTKSTYAGMFSTDYGPPHRGDAKLALFLRAISSVGSWDARCSEFLSILLNLIALLYDTRNLEYPTTLTRKAWIVPTNNSSPRSHSRNSWTGKRRKVESEEFDRVASAPSSWSRMTATRTLVCSTTLDALSLCLRFSHNDLSLSQLQKLFRSSLSVEHVFMFIRLSNLLPCVLPGTLVDAQPVREDAGHEDISYTDGENKLWSSHINACLTLARGRISFRSDDRHVYLGPWRVNILKEISSLCGCRGIMWPLWLPPPLRVTVAANLVCENSEPGCCDAELFIVNGALLSIEEVLNSFATWRFRDPSREHAMVCNAYDEVLLSLEDARLILCALCRLDRDSQRDFFTKLTRIVRQWIETIYERSGDFTQLKDNYEASGFVSRITTFVSNVYFLLRSGVDVRRELFELVGSSQTSSVLKLRQSPQYCAEKSFMGVLGNWKIMDDVSSKIMLEDVDPIAQESMRHVLEEAFRLGFSTGQTDNGHLVYSAWNGLGKSDLWSMKEEIASISQRFVFDASKVPSVILELRDDLCLVKRLLRRIYLNASSTSPLMAAVDSQMRSDFGNKTELSLKIGSCLLAMINKASALVEILVGNEMGEALSMSSQLPSLVHTLATYVCFAASSCTIPKKDFFSAFGQKRKRGNSTESDTSVSDDDTSEVGNAEPTDSLQSFQDICAQIGASPVYPDWLDMDCNLLDRTNPDMALDIAEKANMCITSLVTVCIREVKARQAIVLAGEKSFLPDLDLPIIELCWLDRFWDESSSFFGSRAQISVQDSEGMCVLLSQHLGIETVDMRFAVEILSSKIRGSQSMTSFTCGASQRVNGKLADFLRRNGVGTIALSTQMLRATCEWEILLARGLAPACLGHDEVLGVSARSRQPFLEAMRWMNALSGAIDCFAPVVALIYFGVHRERDVRAIRRSSDIQIDDLERNYECFRSSIDCADVPISLKKSVHETLAVLSVLPSSVCASSLAVEIFTEENSFLRLKIDTCLLKALCILNEWPVPERFTGRELLCRSVVDRLVLFMENALSEQKSSSDTASCDTLLSALCGFESPKTTTLERVQFDMRILKEVIRRSVCHTGDHRNIFEIENFGLLRCLTNLIKSSLPSNRSRIFFVEKVTMVLRNLLEDDDEDGRVSSVMGILKEWDDDALRSLLLDDVCFSSQSESGNALSMELQTKLCSFFSVVLLCKGGLYFGYRTSKMITKTLLESFKIWWKNSLHARVRILNLLLVHSTVTRELHLVGEALMAFHEESKLLSTRDFCYCFIFVSSLQKCLEGRVSADTGTEERMLATLPSVCTYVAFSDFQEQHWYQCFTCGLVGDRGCCSLCALVCHRGHDVSYARKSSFFCDCGAEQPSNGDTSRVRCRCLSAVSKVEIDELQAVKRQSVYKYLLKPKDEEGMITSAFVERLVSLYRKECISALSLFKRKSGFKERSKEIIMSLANDLKAELNSPASLTSRDWLYQRSGWNCSVLSTSLKSRSGSSNFNGTISLMEQPCFSFFREDSLRVTLSSSRQTYLSEKRIKRRAVQADSRGRLFIGESYSVLICNGFAVCRFFQHQSNIVAASSRQALGIIKSIPIPFEAIGLQLAPGNERICAVWGSNHITIFVMKQTLDDYEHRVNLSINIDEGEASLDILKCHWLYGSARYLAVSCCEMLLFYDIEASDRTPVATLRSPIVDVGVSLEIDDFISVPIQHPTNKGQSWEVFVVLRDGTLSSTTLAATHELQQLCLPYSQLSRGQRMSVDSISCGEILTANPCRMHFLSKSSLLLFQKGPFVQALHINDDGKVDHSFPLLPNRISLKLSGSLTTVAVTEYSHWCELGLVSDESSQPYFRVTCIAQQESSDRQFLVIVDFNSEKTNIKVANLTQVDDSSLCQSEIDVIGCATISFPLVERSGDQRVVKQEKASVCMVSAKGSLISFMDGCLIPLKFSVDPVVDRKGNFERQPELLIESDASLLSFEKLTFIESSDEMKSKLFQEINSIEHPEFDGSTVSIVSPCANMVVVTVRVRISTEIATVSGSNRWHDFHLTRQEIIAGIRCGVYSFHINKTFFGRRKAKIDGLELYGVERASIDSWIPNAVSPYDSWQTLGALEGKLNRSQRLCLVLHGLSSCACVFDCRATAACDNDILSYITTETFLSGDAEMGDALKQMVASILEDERQNLLDNALIVSCLGLLEQLHSNFFVQQTGGSESSIVVWRRYRPILRAYLRCVAAVARLRPNNYFRSHDRFSGSIAKQIQKLLDDEILRSLDNAEIISDFVELALLECAVVRNLGENFDSQKKFADFTLLKPVLTGTNQLLVQRATLDILNFCKKYSTEKNLSEEETDLFVTAHSMGVYYCCDFCDRHIKGVRYALEDEDNHIDLCRKCYNDAYQHASTLKFSGSEDVVLGQDSKEDRPRLTCAEVKKLKPHNEATESSGIDSDSDAVGEVRGQVFERQRLFGDFLDGLVCTIGNMVAVEIEKQQLHVPLLIALVDELYHLSHHGSRCDREVWLTRKLVEGLSRTLQRLQLRSPPSKEMALLLVCVQNFTLALTSLVVPDQEARDYLIDPFNDDGPHHLVDSESSPRYKCNHGMPAALRTLKQESLSQRSFYSCCMKSKAHKCNYFEWSDNSFCQRRPLFNENVARKIWEMISTTQHGRRHSTERLLCYLTRQLLSAIEASAREENKGSETMRRITNEDVLKNFNDGVYCSVCRVHNTFDNSPGNEQFPLYNSYPDLAQVRSILELLALVGDEGDVDLWFDPLCAILVSPPKNTSSFRPLAKRCLFQLCGKSPSLFLEVRDTFLFRNRFERLMAMCQEVMNYCLLLNRKASPQKRRGQDVEELEWEKLSLREIIGTTDLITENAFLQDCSSKFGAALEELLLHAFKRPKNWRAFCQSKGSRPTNKEGGDSYRHPICDVLALPSLLTGENRVHSMKLASLAFSSPSLPADSQENSIAPSEAHSASWSINKGEKEDDIVAFIIRFVCGDESQEVRRLATVVARGLCDGEQEAAQLFTRLLKSQVAIMGNTGKLFLEFFDVLNTLVRATRKEFMDIHSMLALVECLFCEQTSANHCDQFGRATHCFEIKKNAAIQRTRFDLIPCGHIISRPPRKTKTKRHPEQVGRFARFRLKTDPNSSSSHDFNHFVVLPHRSVISEIHLEINDPHGRFVKTINFYYSPRPVNSPTDLKETDYFHVWKLCGTLNLERAAEKASLKLEVLVAASNIRIEFDEFYDRPGSNKSDEFVIHCPRCMRVVTNAHGVCGSCGEVAFQCRKCRHINYDRLNAFLCVECGYCASGGLAYELTAAVASNAVAITCDNDYKEALSMFAWGSKISEDLRAGLKASLGALSVEFMKQPAIGGSVLIGRAYEGQLPLKPGSTELKLENPSLKQFDKLGSVVRAIAEKRKCSLNAADRSNSQNTVNSHSRGFHRDDFDDASEFFGGLLESSGMSTGLDRLMASVRRQRERNDNPDTAQHQPLPKNGVAECDHLYHLVHEAQRECFRLERRIEAWQRLETGSMFSDEHKSLTGFQPSRCSVCSPLVTRQLLMLWHSLFLLDPKDAQVNDGMLAILLTEDVTAMKDVQEMKRIIVKDIAVNSEKGRSAILAALSNRLIDRHCAEIIGTILKEEIDPGIVNPFLSLADHILDCNLAL
ncbi:E3 ubiquitin-protein ligase UBR4 [Fistulifera solaris]|uniref:E3 ubiquitin-protein ligase UBR4 n=1 Tax=Fistulifera solaris TaxID=1519565 RepID=A0A1Z5JDE4_FISSO|nr:E3 ubiquitin-protein ligase UBR4 [Fistulifera solaris]|eukprot:GAX11798.1 E3 ubiquitin-protein ligase UBR4 [Fistulifera solaris]